MVWYINGHSTVFLFRYTCLNLQILEHNMSEHNTPPADDLAADVESVVGDIVAGTIPADENTDTVVEAASNQDDGAYFTRSGQ